jgi:hypothetical protein
MREKYSNEIKTHCEQHLMQNSKQRYAIIYLEEWDQIQRFCDYLVQDEDVAVNKQDFKKFIVEVDRRRNTDFVRTFPEFKIYYE